MLKSKSAIFLSHLDCLRLSLSCVRKYSSAVDSTSGPVKDGSEVIIMQRGAREWSDRRRKEAKTSRGGGGLHPKGNISRTSEYRNTVKIRSERYDRGEDNAIKTKGNEREMTENDREEVEEVVRTSGLPDCAGLRNADETRHARRCARETTSRRT